MTNYRLVSFRNAVASLLLLACAWPVAAQSPAAQPRVIEVLADKDSRYKMPGQPRVEIRATPGEQLLLRITARKGQSSSRDGSIHGFTLVSAKERKIVPGWDLSLKPGVQEFHLTAPSDPGEYEVICTVICSEDHEAMHMKFIVAPDTEQGKGN